MFANVSKQKVNDRQCRISRQNTQLICFHEGDEKVETILMLIHLMINSLNLRKLKVRVYVAAAAAASTHVVVLTRF